ncbi:Similar to GTF2E1: General transcription factor IIE subunit 1 (Pongo abelii) [Cotesia congregata]|uniref:General transcription factor IIE subunit 1 n=1 Tax=Cotesia congregata TaxID=51543 RepID=A0A8J2HQR4_COTCN|nr:Similar to GTF2E1: General transcription factor IIE subunit 1 (Pongo abelii) [Cotesia congregata]
MSNEEYVTEVPSSLKKLARLVVRGFYSVEDVLIIDMLVRFPCMKEDDICELLKFERKMLRAKIATLKNDKFIQVRLKMETGSDNKAQKVNYYFINYKTFVNVVKYKLDLMRKKLETEERDATSRSSFKCTNCLKTFTDLEADQLFDETTGEFRCTFCREIVEEDQSALPKKDSRLMLAKYNEQLEPIYGLLSSVDGIKLASAILEPEPIDINTIRGIDTKKPTNARGPGESWSGDASRRGGFAVQDATVDVTIADEFIDDSAAQKKEIPAWLQNSTIVTNEEAEIDASINQESILDNAAATASTVATTTNNKQGDDIMSVLLAHERKGANNSANNTVKSVIPQESDDSSENEEAGDMQAVETGDVEVMESEEDDAVPTVFVDGKSIPITEVDNDLVLKMTPSEKEAYVEVYREYYSDIYE